MFVHGAANDHSVWALQSRYFAHHGRNVFALDLPGHGRSEGQPLASVAAIADWLVALLDALASSRPRWSATASARSPCSRPRRRYPERVARIALLGPSAPMPVTDALLDAAKRDDHAAFEMINAWSFSPVDQLGGNPWPGLWMTGNAMRLMERSKPGVLYSDLAACRNYADGLTAAAKIRCPALMIIGERDQMTLARNAQALIAALPDKRMLTIPGCGHSLMAEAPDAVLDALRVFLKD